ncbi:TPM domain-containing protein [Oleiharenicola lentus]|uniref:TPM domain-containing protein n=1 Tax=Oleiharenicola lentus TaxID=2508720 RepID=UPI003F66B295
MKKADFIQALDHSSIEAAITKAELHTSGEIRVVVANCDAPDAIAAARSEFDRLDMDETRDRNSVLIFIAPKSQTYAVIGDVGVHAKCGDTFWRELADVLGEHFKLGKYHDGLVHGIAKAGKLLGEHFPRRDDDANELSNRVEVI